MGLASSAPPANINALVDELEMRQYFDVLASGVDMPGKPEPSLFLEVARRIGVPPYRCIVVEDAIAGVEAAKRAGMACIAVTTTNSADALSAADIVVHRLDALPASAFDRLLDEKRI
jgi:beta-phosphoglucomutase-like phosphatase (HAD superfamily)